MPTDLLRERLDAVRRRWRTLVALRAATIAGADAVALVTAGLCTWWALRPNGLPLVALVCATGVLAVAAIGRRMRFAAREVTDAQVARLIEERCPDLEDRVATAVAHRQPRPGESPLRASMLRDVAERLRAVEPASVIPRRDVRMAALGAALAGLALAGVLVPFSRPVRQAGTVTGLHLFPARMTLEVTPGDTRVHAGARLTIGVRLPGDATGLAPALEITGGAGRRTEPMPVDPRGGFAVPIADLQESFTYRVLAAGVRSREYRVTVLRPPRVTRIDVRYDYPASFGLAARVEPDSGDLFGPAGTRVRLDVHTDKPVTAAALTMADGRTVPLTPGAGGALEGRLTIDADGSYRVALGDADGLRNPGDTEYFIRTLEDRPPDVRVLRPAADRQVTPVEEVTIQARADDDYGIAAFDLVYTVRGGPEQVAPFGGTPAGVSVTGARTLYLEMLGVQPGDFLTYYARARDVSRGRRSSEVRSDIFFLDVKPFEEEFVASPSQAGQGGETPVDDLARTQKAIVVATWKLDRRAQPTGGASEQDVRTVGRAQGELRTRAQEAASRLSPSAANRRRRGPGAASTGGTSPDGELITRAIEAMGRAGTALDRLSTSGALPHEMTALNELLKAQAEIRRQQVQRQQGQGSGRFQNRQQQDLSALFDRELRRQQATNYETPNSSEARQDGDRSETLDRLRQLAQRQGELNDQQRALARQQRTLDAGDLRRRLDRLTRDQNELRRQVEQLAQQLGSQGSAAQPGEPGRQGSAGQPPPGQRGDPDAPGRPGTRAQGSGAASGGATGQEQASRSAREASEEMGGAAGDLRRQDPGQASARGARALDKLRQIEQQLRTGGGADRRRPQDDGESRRLSEQLARARELQQQMAQLDRQLGELARGGASDTPESKGTPGAPDKVERPGAGASRQPGTPASAGRPGASGEVAGTGGDQGDRRRLQADSAQRLRDTRDLLERMRRDHPELDRAWRDSDGLSPGQSAPGTEAFKQDYARWDSLKMNVAAAIEQLETSVVAKLRDRASRDRLNAGGSDAVPDEYRAEVDRYYKALAGRTGPGR